MLIMKLLMHLEIYFQKQIDTDLKIAMIFFIVL